jgi:hypothetical protein
MRRALTISLFLVVLLGLFLNIFVEFSPISLSSIRLSRWKLPAEKRADKTFVFIIPSYNCSDVCEKTLQSLFNQTYSKFRVVYIDDGSSDKTYERAKEFKDQIGQDPRLEVLHYPVRKGCVERLYESAMQQNDSEIIVYLKGNTWLKSPKALEELNTLYKNHDIWLAYGSGENLRTGKCRKTKAHIASGLFSPMLRHSSTDKPKFKSFYASLFKKVKLEEFFFRGHFIDDVHDSAYFFPLLEMADSHSVSIRKPICSYLQKDDHDLERPSRKTPRKCEKRIRSTAPYEALKELATTPTAIEKPDLLIFSYNRPIHAFALLESLEKYTKGLGLVTVLYRASDERFENAYGIVKAQFPQVRFIAQSNKPEKDFRKLTMKAIFEEGRSNYILFSVDDIVMKDDVNLSECIASMEETGAYFFSLRLGKNIDRCYMGDFSQEVPLNVEFKKEMIAWQLDAARGDWMYPDSVDMTLYRKKDIQTVFEEIDFKQPHDLEVYWCNYPKPPKDPRKRVGLCYNFSKAVNIPLNLVHPSEDRNMNLHTAEELLEKFESGFKISLTPLHQIKNTSVHMEYAPLFVTRKAI